MNYLVLDHASTDALVLDHTSPDALVLAVAESVPLVVSPSQPPPAFATPLRPALWYVEPRYIAPQAAIPVPQSGVRQTFPPIPRRYAPRSVVVEPPLSTPGVVEFVLLDSCQAPRWALDRAPAWFCSVHIASPLIPLPDDLCACPGGAVLVGASLQATLVGRDVDGRTSTWPLAATLVSTSLHAAVLVQVCHCG